MLRNRPASGQAAAKAMRTREVVSVMRAAILSSRARNVANSASASGGFWNGIADCQHQPVGGSVENETHLISECRTATGAVGGELALVLVWTAPDGINCARMRSLVISDKGGRP